MSAETEGEGEDGTPHPSTITLTYDESGWWVARDEDTGVASQGETRQAALEMLDEAVALQQGRNRGAGDRRGPPRTRARS